MMLDNKQVIISKNIIKYRLINNLTQKELAKILKISPKNISAVECSSKKASLSLMIRISKALQVPVDNLLEGTLFFKPADKHQSSTSDSIETVKDLLSVLSLKQKITFDRIIDLYYEIHKTETT